MGCKGIGIRKSEFVAKNQLFKNSWFIGVNNVKVVDDVKFKKSILKYFFIIFIYILFFHYSKHIIDVSEITQNHFLDWIFISCLLNYVRTQKFNFKIVHIEGI